MSSRQSAVADVPTRSCGDANLDLVLLPGAFSHVEHQWEEPSFARSRADMARPLSPSPTGRETHADDLGVLLIS
jgi:hypothetical protein